MNKIKCAVVGVGYLGKFHAQKYAALPDCELVGVVDSNTDNAKAIAEKNHTCAFTDYRELLGQVDAVSIVTPTTLHFEVARDFLEAGTHVLVEKPITVTVEQADELIRIAEEKNLRLMVGHLERFNAAILEMRGKPALELLYLILEW